MARVSVVVANYNGRELLPGVLRSIAAQNFEDFETVVVDDGSTDDSVSYVRSNWPDVRIEETPVNMGMTVTNNRCVAAARGELIAMLNNDLELDPAWLREMVVAVDRHPEVASVACKLLSYEDRSIIYGAGDLIDVRGVARPRGHGEPDRGQYDREQAITLTSTTAALFRARAFDAVGPFDESFGAYFDDADWGLRARLLGYECWYTPRAVAYHMGGGTTGGSSSSRYFVLHQRNQLGLVIKNVPASFLRARAKLLFGHHIVAGLRTSARQRRLGLHLHALAKAVIATPGWLRERRRIQMTRRLTSEEFELLLSPAPVDGSD
jgi:GT2 family glycosyltransferase